VTLPGLNGGIPVAQVAPVGREHEERVSWEPLDSRAG
jgi:hypothetical protein